MNEKELISKIRLLREIKPSQDWVVLLKQQVLEEVSVEKKTSIFEFLPRLIFQYNKLAFASLLVFAIVTGAFTFAQNSLPGDPVYILKKITEKSRAVFVSEENLPKVHLEFANKRLEELNKIAETNQVKKLAPAISEFQANISQAAKNLIQATSSRPEALKGIVEETQKLNENRKKIEALGVVIGETEEWDNALSQLVEREIKDLETRTLTDSQKDILVKIKDDIEQGRYFEALEKILLLSYPQINP